MYRAVLILCLFSSCVFNASPEAPNLAWVEAQHNRDLRTFERAQAELEARYPVPMELDFQDAGAIWIDEIALTGRPGKAFLRLHFTWLNTSTKSYPEVDARLTLTDPATGTEWSETLAMRLPYKYHLTPGSSYTSWFETPIHGLYLHKGWQWRLEVRPGGEAVAADD